MASLDNNPIHDNDGVPITQGDPPLEHEGLPPIQLENEFDVSLTSSIIDGNSLTDSQLPIAVG